LVRVLGKGVLFWELDLFCGMFPLEPTPHRGLKIQRFVLEQKLHSAIFFHVFLVEENDFGGD
jgi:hypothetical protein